MKKNILIVIIAIFFFNIFIPKNVFASIIFSPNSPQIETETISISCTSGDLISWYFQDGNQASSSVSSPSCDNTGTLTITGSGITDQTITFIECDNATSTNSCNFATLTEAESDTGYISTNTFYFTSTTTISNEKEVIDYLLNTFLPNIIIPLVAGMILIGFITRFTRNI